MPVVQADIDEGPAHARHAMSMVTALLLERFQNGAAPLAVVSMDNCSHNGEKLQTSVMTIAKAWLEKGYVGQDFIDYLTDESKILIGKIKSKGFTQHQPGENFQRCGRREPGTCRNISVD